MVRDLARIGIVPGQDFDSSKLTPEQRQEINEGARAASAAIEKLVAPPMAVKPGWLALGAAIGRYGTDYKHRAGVARLGLGANPPEDAIYMTTFTDADGQSFSGADHYRAHFDKSDLPPVKAFWSLTAYDENGYFVQNSINRYAIGDRDPLKFNPDGSLNIYIQNENPGPDHASNWLPSGAGSFNLTIRLYWPGQPILDKTWQPPPIQSIR